MSDKNLPNETLDSLDSKGRAALEKLKERCISRNLYDPEMGDEFVLLRFLKARKFNVAQAEKMWEADVEWRKENDVEGLVKNFVFHEINEFRKYYPQFYHKVDKFGRPLYIENLGPLNIKALYGVTTPERIIKHHICGYEHLLRHIFTAASKSARKKIEQTCTIINLKGVQITQFNSIYTIFKKILDISQNHYPEILGQMFVINSPLLFTAIWNLIKGRVDEATVKKITIVGSDYIGKLLEVIPKENLPKSIGGSCVCDEGCEFSDAGPWKDNAQ